MRLPIGSLALSSLALISAEAWQSVLPQTTHRPTSLLGAVKQSWHKDRRWLSRVDLARTLGPSEGDSPGVASASSLRAFADSLRALTATGNTDVRGSFVDHDWTAPTLDALVQETLGPGRAGVLTPLHAYCLGHALGRMLQEDRPADAGAGTITVAIGRDPRSHGAALARALARGIESSEKSAGSVRFRFLDDPAAPRLASTPAMAWVVAQPPQLDDTESTIALAADAAIMVTASHLPVDKNGLKFYLAWTNGWSLERVLRLGRIAADFAEDLWRHDRGLVPEPLRRELVNGSNGDVGDDQIWVSFFLQYTTALRDAIVRETGSNKPLPLKALKVVLNSGHGSGGFFARVLEDLGADVSQSLHLAPDGAFPAGVPNPESKGMVVATIERCRDVQADLGIMLDTDADRCGFIVPALDGSDFQPLNRNRLIALLGVAFSRQSPGCAIVTDSVTSEGLAQFLTDLGLKHVRYLKGYANVINKAKELTNSGSMNAEVAIETSGHCAMRENGYIDDGTYTAIKVVSILAAGPNDGSSKSPLLHLIETLPEMPVVEELRMNAIDESLDTMRNVFDLCTKEIELVAKSGQHGWIVDKDNLEGIRVRFGNDQFFMLRKSLHDPIISLQIEALSTASAVEHVTSPLLSCFESVSLIKDKLDLGVLR